jgi:LuxR family maltose regulon positive regulatory protein
MPSRNPVAARADPHIDPRVDTPEAPSLSFAPLDRPVERVQPASARSGPPAPPRAPGARPRRRPALVVAGLASAGGQLGMSEYPVQISKVQAPPLREETLARDRLLDWLAVKIHRRAVLLTAEAGYGKTTLLADFSRRTRLRVLWFRLDRGDRDWVGFLAYLVAAVRIHVPDFGAATGSLLRETATAAPSLETVLDTFLRELGSLPNEPSAIVFDDFHLVDDAPDVRHIIRELMTRGPERISFVFASRREPPVRLARLRALGEVAELHTDDLRFDAAETERLFRETYDMRLDPGVLVELRRRTEGWAASLQLVRAALHDRNAAQIRAFISSLSGAEGHLYEYLAEEVVGELPLELQQFLMRTAVLETVDLVLGPVAADVDAAATRAFIEEGERHGLFGKSGPNTRHLVRAHPLVRDFLQDRLLRTIGADGVRALNLRVAAAAERVDWRVATRHYIAAGDEDAARRVLGGAIDSILATGAYATAQDLASSLTSGGLSGAADLILRSRLAQQRAATSEALDLAEQALVADPGSTAVLLNLAAARMLAGDMTGAMEAARFLEGAAESDFASIGRVFQAAGRASVDGSLERAASLVASFAKALRDRDRHHFLGVTLFIEALVRLPMGQPDQVLILADDAIAALAMSSAGVELVSARLVRAAALGQLGDLEAARAEIRVVMDTVQPGQQVEVATEAAELEEYFGEPSAAIGHLAAVEGRIADDSNGAQAFLARAVAHAETGELEAAREDLAAIEAGVPRGTPAFELRRRLAECLIRVLGAEPGAARIATGLVLEARRQQAFLWEDYARVLASLAPTSARRADPIDDLGAAHHLALSMAAEVVVARFADLTPKALATIKLVASARPRRWLEPVRGAVMARGPNQVVAAAILELIGERQDISLLRQIARGGRDPRVAGLGRSLARRLAPRVLIEDLGRIRIEIGDRVLDGSEIRRKVLALLTLLLTRRDWAATREEVVDNLWPELEPQAALNSLNQTVYFLRRVFEPDYHEDTSPGYVQQDGEAIWLDPQLIEARSARCLAIIRGIEGDPDPGASLRLAREYRGKFAIDFLYEDWAGPFRDALHAAFLRVIEAAIRLDIDGSQYARAVLLAERANEVEPESDDLQLALVRIYRLAGAHAAAAEQYEHYSRSAREMGFEPRPMPDR